MPRAHRSQIAGGMYHITARGNRQQVIFVDDADRSLYLSLLERSVAKYGWRCHAYCLMPNHVHLVVETRRPNVSAGVQFLSGRYGAAFNHRHGVSGHLFQGRFHSVLVKHTPQLLVLMRYVALNPVRAGLCNSPELWPWSSYAALMGRIRRPCFLDVNLTLETFGQGRDDEARAALAEFVVGW